jgi:hypothetical protein
MTAGGAPTAPASPAPFTPSGLAAEGTLWVEKAKNGTSPAPAMGTDDRNTRGSIGEGRALRLAAGPPYSAVAAKRWPRFPSQQALAQPQEQLQARRLLLVVSYRTCVYYGGLGAAD